MKLLLPLLVSSDRLTLSVGLEKGEPMLKISMFPPPPMGRIPRGLVPATFEACERDGQYCDYYPDMTLFMESIQDDIKRLRLARGLRVEGALHLELKKYGFTNYNHLYLRFQVGERLVELNIGTVKRSDDRMWETVADVIDPEHPERSVASVSLNDGKLYFTWAPRVPNGGRLPDRPPRRQLVPGAHRFAPGINRPLPRHPEDDDDRYNRF